MRARIVGTPKVSGNRVLLSLTNNKLVALDAVTGDQAWEIGGRNSEYKGYACPSVIDGKILVVWKESVQCLSFEGQIEWEAQGFDLDDDDSLTTLAGITSQGEVVIPYESGNALNWIRLADGGLTRRVQGKFMRTFCGGYCIGNFLLYPGEPRLDMNRVLSIETAKCTEARLTKEPFEYGSCFVVVNKLILKPHRDGLCAWDAESGRELWHSRYERRVDRDRNLRAACDGTRIYCHKHKSTAAYDLADGQLVWRHMNPENVENSDDMIYVTSNYLFAGRRHDRSIGMFDKRTGEELDRFPIVRNTEFFRVDHDYLFIADGKDIVCYTQK